MPPPEGIPLLQASGKGEEHWTKSQKVSHSFMMNGLNKRKLIPALATWYHHPDGTADTSPSCQKLGFQLTRSLGFLVATFFWTKIYINGKYVCSPKSLCSVITMLMFS